MNVSTRRNIKYWAAGSVAGVAVSILTLLMAFWISSFNNDGDQNLSIPVPGTSPYYAPAHVPEAAKSPVVLKDFCHEANKFCTDWITTVPPGPDATYATAPSTIAPPATIPELMGQVNGGITPCPPGLFPEGHRCNG